ncbi:glycosyltransferase family 4 protein [Aquihabitans sp. McL0605]|uniref:glycosyltransferase family 4 protein n=1 Tax=Aquihabitans sp. McL0605 TaxID=3415671 RepID=UPI003CFB75B6
MTTPSAATSPERILVVSPYPPVRDGIGSYTVQQVRALRRQGHHVEVCSPVPSAAHHHLALQGPKGAKALRKLMAGFDRVIVHFHPDIFYAVPSTPTSRISTGTALAAAFKSGPKVEIRLHEVDGRWASAREQVEVSSRSGIVATQVFEAAARATRSVFKAADEITVHVPEHQRMMVEKFGVPADRVRLIDHGEDFTARVAADQAAARHSLGLPADGHVFVCIGFIQPHKGFDRAAAAFRGLADQGASLHIVGSVRVDDPSAVDHQRELEALEAQVPGVHLHLGFVSDDAFDRWIVAADTVVLPYRHIWSSGVAERARLYGRPVIATRVGGLADQLADVPGTVLVDDNASLAVAMATAAGAPRTAAAAASTWEFDGPVDRQTVMAEIHRRAAAQRGIKVKTATGPAASGVVPDHVATPLRRLRAVPPPPATSARPGVSTVKRLIRRVIAWEVDPLREQLIDLQKASVQAAETTDARLEDISDELTD